MLSFWTKVDFPRLYLPLLIALSSLLLLARGMGPLPFVMADEYHYSFLSRLVPMEHTDDPVFLYLSVFQITNFCSSDYLGCARFLNVLFYISGSVFVYLTSRHFVSNAMSIVVLLITLLASEHVYTLFYMPEALYFFVFWVFTYFALSVAVVGGFSWQRTVLSGFLLAALSLVKPHAIFILGIFSLYLITILPKANLQDWRRIVLLIAGLVLVFFSVKFVFGLLVAGKAGVAVFGSRYGGMASQFITAERIFELAKNSVMIGVNHLVMIMFVFMIPVVGATRLFGTSRQVGEELAHRHLITFLALMLILMVGVTAVFSSTVAGTNPYDNLMRIHMRYYNFLTPLLIIVAAVLAEKGPSDGLRRNPVFAVLFAVGLSVGVLFILGLIGALQVGLVDSPGLMFQTSSKWIKWLLVIFGVIVFWIALFDIRRASRTYLFAFLPLVFVVNMIMIQKHVEARKTPDEYDSAGMLLKSVLPVSATEKVVLYGPDESKLWMTAFHVDQASTIIRPFSAGATEPKEELPSETAWVVIFGGGSLNVPGYELLINNGYKIYMAKKY